MRPDQRKVCGKCKEVFRARRRMRCNVWRRGANVILHDVAACPKCDSLNTMPLPAVIRTSDFFNEGGTL